MKNRLLITGILAVFFVLTGWLSALEANLKQKKIPVTVENYNQAEAARNFNNWVKMGADNKLIHLKKLSPVGKDAPTVRMNRDTLYSIGVFKNTGKLSVTLPKSDQFQSLMVIDDHSFNPVSVNGEGTYPVKSDAEYVFITIRTMVTDQNDKAAYEYAYDKQAGIIVTGADSDASASYKMPNYDTEQIEKLTVELIDQLTATGKPYLFLTDKKKITSPEMALHNTQSNASGWGGTVVDYSGESTFYKSSEVYNAEVCMEMNSDDPEDKYFTSLTFYDPTGYILTKGDFYISNSMWKLNADSTLTISMNCGENAVNNINTKGQDYQYTVRHYGANKQIIDGDIDLSKAVEQPPNKASANDDIDIEKLGEQAYLYGLQQVIFTGQRWIYTQNDNKKNESYAGVNRFYQVREQITPDFPVVTPNATTLYGTGFIDLQDEPVILEMPEISDRYYSAQVMDQYGIFHFMAGNLFNGTKARQYIFLPPGYTGKVPGNFVTNDVIYWPSKTGYAVIRIALMEGTEKEIDRINAWQDQITITPLNQWLSNGSQGVPQSKNKIISGTYPIYSRLPEIAKGQVDLQTAEDYFTILNMVLNDPTMPLMTDSIKEAGILKQLSTIGIGHGKQFNWKKLDTDVQTSLTAGFKKGFSTVRESVKENLINLNGWMEVRNAGGYETQWLDRAIMADVGWAGPDRNVSHAGAFLFSDNSGDLLEGKNKYTITFNIDDLPPVAAFWSIPIYNKEGYFVANEIDRYTINSFMLEKNQLYIENDKVVIYVQTEKPSDANQLKNWLPAPKGVFRFTARFYHPKMSIIDGSYKMPKPIKADKSTRSSQ